MGGGWGEDHRVVVGGSGPTPGRSGGTSSQCCGQRQTCGLSAAPNVHVGWALLSDGRHWPRSGRRGCGERPARAGDGKDPRTTAYMDSPCSESAGRPQTRIETPGLAHAPQGVRELDAGVLRPAAKPNSCGCAAACSATRGQGGCGGWGEGQRPTGGHRRWP